VSDETTPRSDDRPELPPVPAPPPAIHAAMPPPPPAPPAPAAADGSSANRNLLVASIIGLGAAMVLGVTGVAYAITEVQQDDSTAASSGTTAGIGELLPSQDDGSTTNASAPAGDASAEQEVGLVYVNTVVDYGAGGGAGTGMILTSSGTILTNHHVIEGATSIEVEVVSTGETYQADVVGYDATADVAVLQLQDASGLTPVTLDTGAEVTVGDEVTSVGNANGDGGAASAAPGTVTDLDQTITAQSGSGSEELTGLIQIDADVVPGDSGGTLLDAEGDVIGMTTAASSGQADITGYAIPIDDAVAIARQITAGNESDTIHIGDSAFLGVQLDPRGTAPVVAGTVEGSAAAGLGIEAGSTITSLDGTAVGTPQELSDLIAQRQPGDSVALTWTDASGAEQTATVTLGTGPVA
jgi:S1-C subfamily serine protease